MTSRYPQIRDGQTIYPRRRGYKLRCCDCGLVHRINFRLVREGSRRVIAFTAYRDRRATAAVRRVRS